MNYCCLLSVLYLSMCSVYCGGSLFVGWLIWVWQEYPVGDIFFPPRIEELYGVRCNDPELNLNKIQL
jgi:hypothetical protein